MSFIRRILIKIFPGLQNLEDKSLNLDWLKGVSNNVVFGEKTKVYAPYSLHNIKIGDGTYLSLNARCSNTTIGKYCSIGPNLICGWGIHPTDYVSTSPYFYSAGKQNGYSLVNKNSFEERQSITIGNDVFIGANVTILDGISIGDGAVIGAGAVVSKDIPPYAIAIGVPIEVKKYRFSKEVIDKLIALRWWDLDDKVHQLMVKYQSDVEQFLKEVSAL